MYPWPPLDTTPPFSITSRLLPALKPTFRSERLLQTDPAPLTTAEFELLGFLVRNSGKVLSRERIIEGTHDINWAAYDRSIDVLISRLRQKLGDDSRRPAFIRTVRGVGYSFVGGGE